MGDFETYKTQITKLSEDYNKMKGIKNKSDFIDAYSWGTDVICKVERYKGIETPMKKKQNKF